MAIWIDFDGHFTFKTILKLMKNDMKAISKACQRGLAAQTQDQVETAADKLRGLPSEVARHRVSPPVPGAQ